MTQGVLFLFLRLHVIFKKTSSSNNYAKTSVLLNCSNTELFHIHSYIHVLCMLPLIPAIATEMTSLFVPYWINNQCMTRVKLLLPLSPSMVLFSATH